MSSDISALNDRLDRWVLDIKTDFEHLNRRLSTIEDKTASQPSFQSREGATAGDNRGNPRYSETKWSTSPSSALGSTHSNSDLETLGATEDAQGAFLRIKDQVNKITLLQEFKVPDAKRGIKKPDQHAADIIGRCGKYAETLIKVLASFQQGDSVEELTNCIYHIAYAQIRYLQERYGTIAVKGVFDPITSDLFDKLQNNALHLDTKALTHLDTAAKLAIVRNQAQAPQTQTHQPYQQRGRGGQFQRRGGYGSGYSGNYGQDSYSNFAQKQFPQRPPRFQQQQGGQASSDSSSKDN